MRWGKSIRFPVARSEGLLIQPLGDEWVIYDDTTKEAHCLRPLAAKVFEHADGHTKVHAIADRVSEELDQVVTVPEIQDVLLQLEERGLMDHGPAPSEISRRDLMRKSAQVGAGAAVAAPLISSVFAAPAWAAGNSKTCGQLLCCTCNTASNLDANNCCFIPHVTQNCECVNASGNSCKFCKPSGTGAPSDADCAKAWVCGGTTGVTCPPTINNGMPLTLAICAAAAGSAATNPAAAGACCGCGCACGNCLDPRVCCGQVNPSGDSCGVVSPTCQNCAPGAC